MLQMADICCIYARGNSMKPMEKDNKTQLISLLSTHLWTSAVHVVQAEAKADTLLVLNALGKTSILVGEYTDLLVLLVAHSEGNMYMLKPSKGKRAREVFAVTQIQEVLSSMKEYMLFIHAFTGCDNTSSLHGKCKSLPFVEVFNKRSSSPQEVAESGEAFMCVIYGGKPSQKINNPTFTISVFPPTSEATKQHSFRVFHRVQEWKNWAMKPSVWGWKLENGLYSRIPIMLEPAPRKLLCLVSCICKTGCDRRSCECLRNCLKCTDICGYCSGFGCLNRLPPIEEYDGIDYQKNSSDDPALYP
ncbi:hypothetical protein PR048_005495 [Dryococelus australis]|uniref:Uncharacterized protein n=1 Tax=Dryococelus australis TaxID=614101 RepID=A0ABQ9I9E6_9NEOP|nr:hypothetical protein PR048_005495 [Dryococelus australis]